MKELERYYDLKGFEQDLTIKGIYNPPEIMRIPTEIDILQWEWYKSLGYKAN